MTNLSSAAIELAPIARPVVISAPRPTSQAISPYEGLRLVKSPSNKGDRAPKAVASDPDLEWLVQSGDSALGARGTLAGIISQIERGSVGGSSGLDAAGCYSHNFTEKQLGRMGYGQAGIGDIERHRWLIAAWHRLPAALRGVLLVRYNAPRAEFRSDGGFGPKDKWVEGGDARPGSLPSHRTGVEALLGEFAGLCFAMVDDATKLLLACQDPQPHLKRKDGNTVVNKDGTVAINRSLEAERRKTRSEILKLARAADQEAHRCWAEEKARGAGPRKRVDRIGELPMPTEALVVFREATPGAALWGRAPRKRELGDQAFGDAVRTCLVASGQPVGGGSRRLVVAAQPSSLPVQQGIDMDALRLALLAEQAPQRGGGLLGLLNAHADEAL